MKLILFFLPFFLSVFVSSAPSFSQEVDIPLFSLDDEPVEEEGGKAPPYIGSNAEPLSSLEILPPPFPSVKVDLPAQEPPPRSRELPRINQTPSVSGKEGASASLTETSTAQSAPVAQTAQPIELDFDLSSLPDLTDEERKVLESHARQVEGSGALSDASSQEGGEDVFKGKDSDSSFMQMQLLPSEFEIKSLTEKNEQQKVMTPRQRKLKEMLSSSKSSAPKKEESVAAVKENSDEKESLASAESEGRASQTEETVSDSFDDDSYKTLFGKATDVYPLDILGFTLKMPAARAYDIAENKGFSLTREIYSIPEILQVPYDVACRKQGIYQLRAVENCKVRLARENNVYYVSELQFEKKKTKEKVTLYFTTPFKGNGCSKIVYVSKGDNSLGSSPRDQEVRDQRQKTFFDLVYKKYDYPDDSHRMIWGNPSDAYLKAYITGGSDDLVLEMEDVIALDEEAVILQDVKNSLPADTSQFSFFP